MALRVRVSSGDVFDIDVLRVRLGFEFAPPIAQILWRRKAAQRINRLVGSGDRKLPFAGSR